MSAAEGLKAGFWPHVVTWIAFMVVVIEKVGVADGFPVEAAVLRV
jgi:hypothetical protein